jgi:polar amino acid transport system permease protein
VLNHAAGAYVEVFRNVPLLVIVYLVFYELPAFGLRVDSFTSGVIALALNSTAYTVEIFRGGLAAIPQGQYEAAHSLAFRAPQTLRHIVLPQLMRISFPALGNQVVGVILGSALVSVVGVAELTNVALKVGSQTFRYFEVFIVVGAFYLVAVQLINRLWVFAGERWIAAPATTGRSS